MLRAVLSPVLFLVVALLSAAAVLAVHEIEAGGSAIGRPQVAHWFSPNGDGRLDAAAIRFRLDDPDAVTVTVRDAEGDLVRTLVRRREERGGVRLGWDGLDDRGRTMPEGVYHARVELHELGRTFDVQSPMVLDVTPPRIGSVGIDVTRVPTLGVVRVQANGVEDSSAHWLELAGERLELRGLPRRAAPERKANSFERFVLSANMPAGAGVRQAGDVQLVVADRAGNRTAEGGDVLPGPVRIPERGAED